MLQIENQVSTYAPNGYMVVYAVDDEESLATAERVLNYLKNMEIVHRDDSCSRLADAT